MHRLFADWYKQADLNPTAEVLNTRWSGVEIAVKKLDQNMVLHLTRTSFGLGNVHAASSETDGLANAFKEADVSFPMKGNENLLRVLAAVTLVQCMESRHVHATFVALCVTSASCHGLRSMPSVDELPTIAREYLASEGQSVRERGLSDPVRPPNFAKFELTNPTAFEIQDTPNQNHWAQVNQNFQHLKVWVGQVSTAIQALSAGLTNTRNETSSAFMSNAERTALQNRINVLKEECDVLWWLFGEFSERFNLLWKDHRANEMCLLLGEELAELFAYYIPPPNTQAFLSRALSIVAPYDGKLNLETAITSAPVEWAHAVADRVKSAIPRAGGVTPFHTALFHRLGENRISPSDGEMKSETDLTAAEYAYQMLIETLLLLHLVEAENA